MSIEKMKPSIDELRTQNTVIISALGNKFKLVRRQILCGVMLQGYLHVGIFLVVPKLIHNCILEISFLRENNCIIDFESNKLKVGLRAVNPMLVPVCVIREEENQMDTEREKLDHVLEEKILDIEGINGE